MISNSNYTSRLRLNVRGFVALIGVLLVCFGQQMVAKTDEMATPSNILGIWINDTLRLGLPTIDHVLQGFLLLLAGGALLAFYINGLHLYSEEAQPSHRPLNIGLMRSAWPFALIGAVLFGGLLLQLQRAEYHSSSPWIWVISLSIFLGIVVVWDWRRGVNLSPDLPRQDLMWLVGLLIAGLLIVTYRLQGWPDQLMHDEGIFGSTARDVAMGTFKPPIFAQGVNMFPILSTFWQAGVMRLFGVNIWGWRFGSVLPGVMSIVPLYLFARDAFSRRAAVISCVVLFTGPYFLVYSRLGYTNVQPVFIMTLALYLLYTGLRRTSYLFLFVAGYIAGLGFYTYYSGRAAFVFALLFIGLLWLTRRLKFKNAIFAIFLFVLGTILVALPHIIYGIHQDLPSMGYRLSLSLFNSVDYGSTLFPLEELFSYAPSFRFVETDLFYNPKIFLVVIVRGFVQTLLPFQKPGLLWGAHYLACPLTGTYGAFFYILGLVVSLRYAKQWRFQLVILWFFTVVTALSALNTFPPREDHMVPIVPAIALLTGFGLEAVAVTMASSFDWLRKYQNSILAILLMVVAIGGLQDYFLRSAKEFPPNPENIMSWAGLDSHGESILYVYDVPIRPDFVPWMMSEFRNDILFRTFHINEVMANGEIIGSDRQWIIFYPPEVDSQITQVLQARWGDSLTEKVFLNVEGNPVLMAGMNSSFVFERDRPFVDTLLDAFRQTRFVILLVALMVFLALTIFLPSSRLRFPPSETNTR